MSDHALHFVIRLGVWGVAGGAISPSPYGFWLFGFFFGGEGLVSSVTYGDDDNILPSGGALGAGGRGANAPL